MKSLVKFVPLAILVVGLVAVVSVAEEHEMPFGGEEDVAFAERLWKAIDGYEADWKIKTDLYPGRSPHGKFLRTYYNVVNIDETPYHVIIKDNYGGEGATMETVSEKPQEYLAAVTVMVQRNAGYDSDHNNWFWVKYGKDGTIDKNPKGIAMAGRVAKGMDQGCIACHASATDGDYIFINDQ